jgi:predicted SnoaL-like aldol condensation-catalyzing enzyme
MRFKSILVSTGFTIAMLASATPAAAHDHASEAANKQVVLGFYQALNDADNSGTMQDRIKKIAETYLSPDYMQHSDMFAGLPGPGTARDKLIRMFQTRPAMKPMPAARTIAVMAEGDLVMMLTARDLPDPTSGQPVSRYIFNMFRVKAGKLAEHWDVGSAPPPMPASAQGNPMTSVPPKP